MPQTDHRIIIECQDLTHGFNDANGQTTDILKGINFNINKRQMIAIIGASGSGKTTLLQLLGGLDTATSGIVLIDGQNPANITDNALSQLRNQKLGFVYQFHHLIAEITTLENICMPLFIAGMNRQEALDRGEKMLNDIGLYNREKHIPAKLSGGERQRVAIGRAMINQPLCLLADEPTGNLDHYNADKIIDLIAQLNEQYQMSVLMNTHDNRLAKKMDQIYALSHGLLHLQTP